MPVPAFFIAGAITVFVSQASVMKYLGPLANKFLAYSVASVRERFSLSALARASLFAGIYKMGRVSALPPLFCIPPCHQYSCHRSLRESLGWQIGLARASVL